MFEKRSETTSFSVLGSCKSSLFVYFTRQMRLIVDVGSCSWKDALGSLENYVDTLGTQFSVFDCPLHYNFKEAGDKGDQFE